MVGGPGLAAVRRAPASRDVYPVAVLSTSSTDKGYFVSSSDELNRIWYDGAYTVSTVQMRPGTPGGYWEIENGELSADGGGVGQLSTGSSWTDYTDSFKTTIVANQALGRPQPESLQ